MFRADVETFDVRTDARTMHIITVSRAPLILVCCLCACGGGDVRGDDPRRTPTPHLDQAVELVRDQVSWFGPKPQRVSREFLCAVAVMNFVQSRVSPLNYAVLSKGGKVLPRTAEEYLTARAGICGGQVMTFREILDRLDIRNRPVEFYMRGPSKAENHSHIGAEVFYADKWHFFDITWGTFFRSGDGIDDVLSIGEIRKTDNVEDLAVTNHSDLWFQQWKSGGLDPFEYITWKETDVIVGRDGIVILRPDVDPEKGQVYTPTHQPGYVGRNNRSSDFGTLSFRLTGAQRRAVRCTVSVSGVAGSGQLVIRAKTGAATVPLSDLTPGDHKINISRLEIDDELTVSVDSGDGRQIGYVVIRQISVQAGNE
jgi:hypothetical protein